MRAALEGGSDRHPPSAHGISESARSRHREHDDDVAGVALGALKINDDGVHRNLHFALPWHDRSRRRFRSGECRRAGFPMPPIEAKSWLGQPGQWPRERRTHKPQAARLTANKAQVAGSGTTAAWLTPERFTRQKLPFWSLALMS